MQKTDASLELLRDDLESLRKDVDKLVRALGSDASSYAADTVDDAKKQLKKMAKAARKKGDEGLGEISAQIEENPFTSIATAFGIGMIVGRLMGK